MIKKFLQYSLFFIFLLQPTSYAIIFESNRLEDVYNYIDKDSIVVFDIDHTMATVSMEIEPWIYHETARLEKKGLNHKEAFEFVLAMFHILTELTKLIPIGSSPQIVKTLQKEGICVIALTNRSIPVIEKTVRQLKEIGIDLSKNSFADHDLEIPVTYMGRFSRGIIFTGYNDKGKMLFTFLKKIGYQPKKIIFIDDNMIHVKSVEKAAKENNTQFVGIRFSLMDKMKKDFDLTKAEKNIDTLKIKLGINPLAPTTLEKKHKENIGWCQLIKDIFDAIILYSKKVFNFLVFAS